MTEDSIHVSGRIDTKVYDEDPPEHLSESAKIEWLRDRDPVHEQTDYNTTTQGMHEYFAINLNPAGGSLDLDAGYLAVGDDDTAPSSSDTALNNEVFRKQTSDGIQSGNELQVDTLIESGEANGNTLREVGLFTDTDGGANERMLNHSTIADIAKDQTRNITIEVTLTFTAA